MAEFDLYAGIRKLAEAEGDCPSHVMVGCAICKGTGRIVPFPSLRVKCPCPDNGGVCNSCSKRFEANYAQATAKADFSVLPPRNWHMEPYHGAWCNCKGRGWVPEPDVRVACWEIMKLCYPRLISSKEGYMALLSSGGALYVRRPDSGWCPTPEEAVLRAALAWVKEQHG